MTITFNRISLILFFGFFLASTAAAQSPCSSEHHRQFDFWVGDWIVHDTTGTTVGENLITRLTDGCIVSEHWVGTSQITGKSYNYFDTADSTWNQLWIDNQGTNLKLRGRAVPNGMVMSSGLTQNPDGVPYFNRITWLKQDDGTVTQVWDAVGADSTVLSTAFHGIYTRKKPAHGEKAFADSVRKITSAIFESSTDAGEALVRNTFSSSPADSVFVRWFSNPDDRLNRILTIANSPDGTLSTEWYFDHGGNPLFIYQTFEYADSLTPNGLWKNFKGLWAWESRYYMEAGNVEYQIHSGRLGVVKKSELSALLKEARDLFAIVRTELSKS